MDKERYRFYEEEESGEMKRRGNRGRNHEREEMRRQREQKKKQAIVISIVAVLIVAALAVFIAFTNTGLTSAEEENTVVTEEMLAENNGFESFTLLATGDNLLHTKLYTEAANRAENGGYDFTFLYQDVADITKGTDVCFINQETPLATAIHEVSSYPLFNTPSECVFALHDIGFNVFNIVSNHTLDQGADGMKATVDVMESIPDSLYVGTYYNKEEMEKTHIINVNDLDVAFVGFTEMTNGLVMDSSSEMAFVYTSDEAEMEKLIKSAKKEADVVIVSVHWGEENVLSANETQRALGQKFADWGADLILGHHPHVLQEIETITSADGRTVPICYSLGNFTSTMDNKANHVGGFFKCTVVFDNATRSVSIADEEFIPLINYFGGGKTNIHVIPFSEYTPELAAKHGSDISVDYVNNLLNETVGADLVKGLKAPKAQTEEQ